MLCLSQERAPLNTVQNINQAFLNLKFVYRNCINETLESPKPARTAQQSICTHGDDLRGPSVLRKETFLILVTSRCLLDCLACGFLRWMPEGESLLYIHKPTKESRTQKNNTTSRKFGTSRIINSTRKSHT